MQKSVNAEASLTARTFKKGEVTAEEAHEIGLETMKRMLDEQYEFVLSTHVDKACIHNHIIINSDRKSTRLNSSHSDRSRMPSSA